jgi:hypothetical protein
MRHMKRLCAVLLLAAALVLPSVGAASASSFDACQSYCESTWQDTFDRCMDSFRDQVMGTNCETKANNAFLSCYYDCVFTLGRPQDPPRPKRGVARLQPRRRASPYVVYMPAYGL